MLTTEYIHENEVVDKIKSLNLQADAKQIPIASLTGVGGIFTGGPAYALYKARNGIQDTNALRAINPKYDGPSMDYETPYMAGSSMPIVGALSNVYAQNKSRKIEDELRNYVNTIAAGHNDTALNQQRWFKNLHPEYQKRIRQAILKGME